jgi:hypothetical protein
LTKKNKPTDEQVMLDAKIVATSIMNLLNQFKSSDGVIATALVNLVGQMYADYPPQYLDEFIDSLRKVCEAFRESDNIDP